MFCKYCGNELREEAVVCPKCGCAVKSETKAKPAKTSSERNGLVLKTLNYITVGLVALSLMFFALSIVYMFYRIGYLWLEDSFVIPSFIFAVCAYCMGTIAFVLGFIGDNKKKRFTSDVLFIIVNCLLPVAINALCMCW